MNSDDGEGGDGIGINGRVSTGQDADLALFLEHIHQHHRHDFRNYAAPSLQRRLHLVMPHLQVANIGQLHAKVSAEPEIYSRVLPYLAVSVSDMFRDPLYYRALREDVLPLLREGLHARPILNVWVAGCSAGEEAYSIAILLHEAGLLDQSRVYATDINPMALSTASQGIFPLNRLQAYTLNYRAAGGKAAFSDYYHVAYGSAMFDRFLREHVIFAEHSLVVDEAFSGMQLISCRNVLIYFNRALQRKTLAMLAGALGHNGFLGLGGREALGPKREDRHFERFAPNARIYRKRPLMQ